MHTIVLVVITLLLRDKQKRMIKLLTRKWPIKSYFKYVFSFLSCWTFPNIGWKKDIEKWILLKTESFHVAVYYNIFKLQQENNFFMDYTTGIYSVENMFVGLNLEVHSWFTATSNDCTSVLKMDNMKIKN